MNLSSSTTTKCFNKLSKRMELQDILKSLSWSKPNIRITQNSCNGSRDTLILTTMESLMMLQEEERVWTSFILEVHQSKQQEESVRSKRKLQQLQKKLLLLDQNQSQLSLESKSQEQTKKTLIKRQRNSKTKLQSSNLLQTHQKKSETFTLAN